MSRDPTPAQSLLLFSILARHGACAQAELMPAVKKADRDDLVTAKLIGAPKVGRSYTLTLTDAGWAWAASHLVVELPPPQRALADLLARLGEHLERSGATLADVIGSGREPDEPPPKPAKSRKAPATAAKPKPPRARATRKAEPAQAPKPLTTAALRRRIEAAYLALTRGRKDLSVRLAQLRAELADLNRDTVDAALGRILKGDKTAALMRHDDPRQLKQADHDAAYAPAGEPFHLLWIAS